MANLFWLPFILMKFETESEQVGGKSSACIHLASTEVLFALLPSFVAFLAHFMGHFFSLMYMLLYSLNLL